MPHAAHSSGFKTHDLGFLAARALARARGSAGPAARPGEVLAAFKRVHRQVGASVRLAHLVDLLFAWTKPQDWEPGQAPVVWPRNDLLAELTGLQVRQVQNLLRQGERLGLFVSRCSPNGHRGGRRDGDGRIVWAYGIDLSPLGTRHGEFVQLAAAADAERRSRLELRRRITVARRAIAAVAETGLGMRTAGIDWLGEADVARLAASHARRLSDVQAMADVAEQLERRLLVLEQLVCLPADPVPVQTPIATPAEPRNREDIAPTNGSECTHITTTTALQPQRGYGSGNREKGSGEDSADRRCQLQAEADLERYHVTVDMLFRAAPYVCAELEFTNHLWRDAIRIAERQAMATDINLHGLKEAFRLLGPKAGAVAVIATLHKHQQGDVRSPGAYLRGIVRKALAGDLSLGRTIQGMRKAALN